MKDDTFRLSHFALNSPLVRRANGSKSNVISIVDYFRQNDSRRPAESGAGHEMYEVARVRSVLNAEKGIECCGGCKRHDDNTKNECADHEHLHVAVASQ